MVKLDLTKELKELYRPSGKKVRLVQVPEMGFLMVDGAGDPNTEPRFRAAMEALYSLSYRLRHMVKHGRTSITYKVMPLEGLWWMGDNAAFDPADKDAWQWTLMIMQPDFVTAHLLEEARAEVAAKRKLTILDDVRLERFDEGLSAQVLHMGTFNEEGYTLEAIQEFMGQREFEPSGKHHKIYLGDHRRTAPEKRKTIIRQPVRKKLEKISVG